MLQVTNDAMHICSETVRQLSGQSMTRLLRINKRNGGIRICFEDPRSDDEILHHKGRPVIAIPEDIADDVSDMTLDFNDKGRLILS